MALRYSKICRKAQTFHRVLELKIPEFEEILEKTEPKGEEKVLAGLTNLVSKEELVHPIIDATEHSIERPSQSPMILARKSTIS